MFLNKPESDVSFIHDIDSFSYVDTSVYCEDAKPQFFREEGGSITSITLTKTQRKILFFIPKCLEFYENIFHNQLLFVWLSKYHRYKLPQKLS